MNTVAPKPVVRRNFNSTTLEDFKKEVSNALFDFERQAGAQGRILPHNENGKRPKGLRHGDRLMGRGARGTVLGVTDDIGNAVTKEVPDSVTQFQDPQTGSGAPTTSNFPTVGDFGWYRDTTNNLTYFVQNRGGAIDEISLKTFSGVISDLSGSISAAQHGSLTNNSTARHSNATNSVDGFMSAADKTTLNNATNADTPSTLAARDGSGNCFFNILLAENSVRTGPVGSDLKVLGQRGTGFLNIATTPLKDGSAITTTFNSTNFALLVRFVATVFDYLGTSGHGLIDL